MHGDDRVRHCSACDKKVYDSAGLTRAELESLVAEHEGRRLPCFRLHRRFDGTIITRDCLTPTRRAAAWLRLKVAVAAGFVLALFGGAALAGEHGANMPIHHAGATSPPKAKRPSKAKAPPKPPPPPVRKKAYDDYVDQGLGDIRGK
jgi:hypothetical protein